MPHLLLLLLVPFMAMGQRGKAVKYYERAESALTKGNGAEAERMLKQAIEADSTLLEAHLMLAEWLLDAGRKEESLQHYAAVTRQNATFHTPAWLEQGKLELDAAGNFARVQSFTGASEPAGAPLDLGTGAPNYDKAIYCFQRFLELDKRAPKRRGEAERGIETARFRKEAVANPVEFNPINLGAAVNSADDEYLPALTVDGGTLIFTRRFPRRATTTANTPKEEDLFFYSGITNPLEQITNPLEHDPLRDAKDYHVARPLPHPLNSNDNEGAECISQDGRIIFFTACGRPDGGGRCDIYMCVRRGDKWGKPRNIGMPVNSGAWEGQPSFSIDGKTLYFVSNRKGGYGGMDIWKTTFEDGKWTEPVNLGPEINTPGNEMSPFIHYDDQTLYFASDGHVGMGGMDIFVARRTENGERWSTPVNLGYPINTPGDESSLIVDASASMAYFASDRPGGFGGLDIYCFELPQSLRPTPTTCYQGKVTDAKTGAPLASDLRIVDLSSGETVANTSSDGVSGDYTISLPSGRSYAFHVTAKGYLFHSETENGELRTENGERKTEWRAVGSADNGELRTEKKTIDIKLQPIEAGSSIALRNIFFETGKAELLPSSDYEIDRLVELLKNNPTMKVEIAGHTDNVGSDQANLTLSEARAKAVRDRLIAKGINASRLSFRGYGESRPVASNDTPEGRAENRRVEMTIQQ